MNNCIDCEHSVFNQKWGEFKCKKNNITMYILLDASECPNYKKEAEPKTFKEDEDETDIRNR